MTKEEYIEEFTNLSEEYYQSIDDKVQRNNDLCELFSNGNMEHENERQQLSHQIQNWINNRVNPLFNEYLKLIKAGITGIEDPSKFRPTPIR